MGYMHQVISDTMAPKLAVLPGWFVEKYGSIFSFDGTYWASKTERKRYGSLKDLDSDVQRMLREIEPPDALYPRNIRLVYFADESCLDCPDIIHTTINRNEITELVMTS